MKLPLDQIKSAITGAVSIMQEDGLVRFHRMHPAQLDAALARSEAYHIRAHSTTGVKLTFRTDSTSLFLDVSASRGTMSYFAVDVLVDGTLIGSVDNFSHEEIPVFHTQKSYKLGDYSGRFDLGPGEKTVRVHLFWGPVAVIDCFPFIPRDHLCFGDGILHPNAKGFDYYFKGL